MSQAVRTGPASSTFHLTTVSAEAQARFGLETSSSRCHTFSRWARHRAFLQKPRSAAGFAKALPSLPLPQEGVTPSFIMAIGPMGTAFSLLVGTARQLQTRLVDLGDTSSCDPEQKLVRTTGPMDSGLIDTAYTHWGRPDPPQDPPLSHHTQFLTTENGGKGLLSTREPHIKISVFVYLCVCVCVCKCACRRELG